MKHMFEMFASRKLLARAGKVAGCVVLVALPGCLFCSHCGYARRADAARAIPEGEAARPGRIYFVSFPENCLEVSVCGWHPNVGHASLVTSDGAGTVKQYDYGWFVGRGGGRPSDAIGHYVSDSYGVVTLKKFSPALSARTTNDMAVAQMLLDGMPEYGDKVELWAKDVGDIGIAERYMEQLAEDKDRGSMAWRCWQIGGSRCGNITRQAFDAARGEGHFLDLLWGGFPGADAPSIGADKTTCTRKAE